MSPRSRSVRDGVLAVSLGAVLGVGLLVGVRATGQWDARAAEPVDATGQPALGADACLTGNSGGGGNSAPPPDPVAGPDFPRQDHGLDTGHPVQVSGTGNAEVAYHRKGDFATVVDFSCANCTGELNVLNTGADTPIVSGETIGEKVDIEWLIDTVHEDTQRPDNSLLIQADGDWTLGLRSWHDLPVETHRVDGRGSQVVRVASPQVRVGFAPLNSRDTLHVYAYRLGDRELRANECIGRFESRDMQLVGGDVLLVWARGEWSLEPV